VRQKEKSKLQKATSMQTKKTYDAFLAVNKADSAAAHFVRSIAKWLEDHAGLTVWLEEWEMIPGTPWMESRESALENSNCCVVFIGSEGIGLWQNESWRSAYETFVEKKRLRVIPAILPGGPTEEVDLPSPFRRVYYLTFRDIHDEDGLEVLKKAIKGEKVGRESTGARYEKVSTLPAAMPKNANTPGRICICGFGARTSKRQKENRKKQNAVNSGKTQP